MKFSSRIEVTKPVKLIGILSAVFFIWILYSYNDSRRPPDTRNIKTTGVVVNDDMPEVEATKPPDPRVVVDVYYECLCPDSRYFVLHELLPAQHKIGSLMNVRMWPYGKASTEETDQGSIELTVQSQSSHWELGVQQVPRPVADLKAGLLLI